jgi:hypothetical protein
MSIHKHNSLQFDVCVLLCQVGSKVQAVCWPQAVHLEAETFITVKTTDVMVTSVVYYLRAIYQVYSLYIINLILFI